jgi:WD40 repeat protein
VAGALAQHAEQTMDRIGTERQGVVREIFRNLVTSQGTRAVAEREELLSVFPERGVAETVLAQLVDARLLTSYEVEDPARRPECGSADGRAKDPTSAGPDGVATTTHRVEIAHESLIRAWPRLVRWQAQEEEGAVLRDQLKQAAHLWEEKARSPDVLWSGTALREYELWRERYAGKLTVVEESFASAMLERDRRRRRYRRAAVAALVAGLATVAVVVSVSRQQAVRHAERAEREARRAEASKLVALAELRLEEDPTEALALATASLELADTREARLLAVRALAQGPPAREVFVGGAGRANAATFCRNGRWLVAGGAGEEVRVWSSQGGDPLVLGGHAAAPTAWLTGRCLDDRHLVTGPGMAARLHVWSLPEGNRLRTIELGGPSAWPSGMNGTLVTGTLENADGTGRETILFRSWRLPDGDGRLLGRAPYPIASDPELLLMASEPNGRGWIYARGRDLYFEPLPARPRGAARRLGRHTDKVTELWEHGDTLVSTDDGGESRIWSFPLDGPRLDQVVPLPPNVPRNAATDPSGRWRWEEFMSERGRARLWDLGSLPGARPLELRRSGSWSNPRGDFEPGGDWFVVTLRGASRVTLWPVAGPHPSVVESFLGAGPTRPVAFSPDGRWLAAAARSGPAGGVRLWPLPGTQNREVKVLSSGLAVDLAFDPQGRFLAQRADVLRRNPTRGIYVLPLDGSPSRALLTSTDTSIAIAVSPRGRRVATAFFPRAAEQTLCVWDLETGDRRDYELPPAAPPLLEPEWQQSVLALEFEDESTLYTAGDGGIRRWNLDTGEYELVWAPEPEKHVTMAMSTEARVALTAAGLFRAGCHPVGLYDLSTGEHRELPEFGSCVQRMAIDPSGRVGATGDESGLIRVGRLSGGPPHLLYGHEGPLLDLAISPDLKWVASTGEDDTLRLWPIPDLDTPPLHTLPHEELVAKLRSLTNIRAVRAPESSMGWRIELDAFPGWEEVPTW